MTVSYANVNPVNMELTPCRVTLGGVDVGGTKGNVKVSIKYEKSDIKADQLGNTVLDRRVSGIDMSIEFILAEINLKDSWKVAFPNAVKVGTGPYGILFNSKIGEADSALAKALVLHPLSKADVDVSADYNFYKAVAESVSEVTFGPTEQQGLKVVLKVLPDFSVSPVRFGFFGDPAIGVIAASIGSPVFTGTGNGTITALSAGSATITETITVECVGVPALNEANFIVKGSLSGVIGLCQMATSPVNFVSDYINFTITDGLTDFVIGDSWSIPTTGANYV